MGIFRDRGADDARFAQLVREATPSLTHTAWLLTGDADASRELVQAALVKTYLSWSRVDPATAVGYARRVLVNHHTDTWRKGRREVTVDDFHDGVHPTSSPHDLSDARDEVVRLLATLPTRQREVVVLRYYSGLSEREVAETLGISTGSVKTHASRGLTALRAIATEGAPS